VTAGGEDVAPERSESHVLGAEAVDAVEQIITESPDAAMRTYNGRKPDPA